MCMGHGGEARSGAAAIERRSLDFFAFLQGGDDSVKHVQLLIAWMGPGKKSPQVSCRIGSQLWSQEKSCGIQLGFQALKKSQKIGFRGWSGRKNETVGAGRRIVCGCFHPLPAEQQDSLCQVEGIEFRIHGEMEQGICAGKTVVVQTGRLRSKQDCCLFDFLVFRRCQDSLDYPRHRHRRNLQGARASGGSIQAVTVGDGVFKGFKAAHMIQDFVRIGCGCCSRIVRPAATRVDQAKLIEATVPHRPGTHANVFTELGLVEDDDRWFHGGEFSGVRYFTIWSDLLKCLPSPNRKCSMEPQIVIKQGMSIGYRSGWRYRTVPDLHLADAPSDLTLGIGRHLLLARNGRGKTTLLKTLAGLLPTFSGDFSVEGQVQFIDEELRFDPELKSDNILAALFRGECRDRALAMADRLELDLRKPYGKLSKGNKQKVTLIVAETQAGIGGPQVMLLDEPFSGLDFHVRDEMDAIWQENHNGVLRLVCVHPDEPTLRAESALIISGEKITHLGVESGQLDWFETRKNLS